MSKWRLRSPSVNLSTETGQLQRCDLDPEPVIERVAEVVAAVPGAVARAAATVREEGIDHEIVGRLEAEISDHSERCLRNLA